MSSEGCLMMVFLFVAFLGLTGAVAGLKEELRKIRRLMETDRRPPS